MDTKIRAAVPSIFTWDSSLLCGALIYDVEFYFDGNSKNDMFAPPRAWVTIITLSITLIVFHGHLP
jgi:hypothetical protein